MPATNSSPQAKRMNFKDIKYIRLAGILSIIGGALSAIVALVVLLDEVSDAGLIGLAYVLDLGVALAYVVLGWLTLKAPSVQRVISVLRTLAAIIIIHLLVVVFGGLLVTGEFASPGLIFIAVILCVSLAFRSLHEAGLTTSPAPFKAKAVE